jgi:hypothetical protein
MMQVVLTAYWPLVIPSPEAVTLTVFAEARGVRIDQSPVWGSAFALVEQS